MAMKQLVLIILIESTAIFCKKHQDITAAPIQYSRYSDHLNNQKDLLDSTKSDQSIDIAIEGDQYNDSGYDYSSRDEDDGGDKKHPYNKINEKDHAPLQNHGDVDDNYSRHNQPTETHIKMKRKSDKSHNNLQDNSDSIDAPLSSKDNSKIDIHTQTKPGKSTKYYRDGSTKPAIHEDDSDYKLLQNQKIASEINEGKKISQLGVSNVLGPKVEFDGDNSDIDNFDFGLHELDEEHDINLSANHISPTDWIPILENYVQVLTDEENELRSKIKNAEELKLLEEQLLKREKDDFEEGEKEKLICANLEYSILSHVNSLPIDKQKIVFDVDRDGIPDFDIVDIEQKMIS